MFLFRPSRPFALIAVACISLVISGCTSFRPVAFTSGQTIESQLEVGDKVKITRRDGTDVSFVITHVDETTLSGDSIVVAVADIATIEVRRPETAETVLAIIGVVVVILVYIGKTLADDFSDAL